MTGKPRDVQRGMHPNPGSQQGLAAHTENSSGHPTSRQLKLTSGSNPEQRPEARQASSPVAVDKHTHSTPSNTSRSGGRGHDVPDGPHGPGVSPCSMCPGSALSSTSSVFSSGVPGLWQMGV